MSVVTELKPRLAERVTPLPPPMPEMLDRSILQAIQRATQEVLRRMCGTSVTLRGIQGQRQNTDFLAMGLNAQDGEQQLSLSLSKDLANRLVANMVGSRSAKISTEICKDGVGELINIIAGAFKAALTKGRDDFYSLSLPVVKPGSSDRAVAKPYAGMPSVLNPVVLYFETEGELFSVQINR